MTRRLADLGQDLRYALRWMVRNPRLSLVVLVTLALGIGAATTVFSVVYGVLLRPLPYAEPGGIVRVWEEHPGALLPFPGTFVTRPTYHAWNEHGETLEDLAAFVRADRPIDDIGATGTVRGMRVAPAFFRVLRAGASLGRLFTAADAAPGAEPVVVLSHASWRQWFGVDPSVLNRYLRIEEITHRIVGVTAESFDFIPEAGRDRPNLSAAYYLPLEVPPPGESGAVGIVSAIGRLADGATPAQAAAEGTSHARAVERRFAHLIFGEGGAVEMRVAPLVDQMTREIRPALLVLGAGVGLLLLAAAANVANLLLSRNLARSRELAIRTALGAGRTRLVRLLLTESLTLAALGGALGLTLSWGLTRVLPRLGPVDLPRLAEVRPDLWLVAGAALATSIVGGVIGVIPARRLDRLVTASARQIGGPPATGRLRQGLLVTEAALAVVLLVGSVLLGRSFVALLSVDAGYNPTQVVVATLRPPASADAREHNTRVTTAVVDRLRATSGVVAAAGANMSPLGFSINSMGFRLPGLVTETGEPRELQALLNVVTPGYGEALGLRLVEGRFLETRDASSEVFAFLVNETFVRTYLDDGRPVVGRRFDGAFPQWLDGDDGVASIVGVVGDVLLTDLDEGAHPQLYVPTSQNRVTLRNASVIVRVVGDPTAMTDLVAATVAAVDPATVVDHLGTLSGRIATATRQPRFLVFTLSAFGAVALLLAAVGLHGVLAYAFAQRRQEFGVRAVLGASRADLARIVLRQGLVPTGLGLLLGLVLAALASRVLSSVLFGVSPLDTVSFVTGSAVVLLVASVACGLVARRVTAIDPRESLAAE